VSPGDLDTLGQDVNSPAFKKWFGESKVVDKEGKPLVVHHGGLGIADATEFSKDYGGQNTGNNEHGAFHFVDVKDIADDYGRQSFNRRYQDDPEGLVQDGYVKKLPKFKDYDAQYKFVNDLADKNIQTQSVHLSLKNPVVMDMHGERIDVAHIEALTKFLMHGEDPTGELHEQYADQIHRQYSEQTI
jgi:hypothetical protein